jgi:N-acetylglucosamine malate deacetylase 2
MKNLILILFVCVCFSCDINKKSESGIVLIILAHPDDETALGSVIAKLTKENKTILLIATDGRNGVREHAGNISGDTLAAIRRKELICSCEKLGIDSLIHLNYHGGMGMRTSVGEFFTQTRKMKEEIKMIIEKINPTYIISFGPDGDTGHADHRHIGNLVTEILLRESWVEKFPLYFLAWTKEQSELMGGLNYMANEYLNVAISFTDEDEQKNWKATKCHWSQFTEEEIQEFIAIDKQDTSNTLYFRRFVVERGLKQRFY